MGETDHFKYKSKCPDEAMELIIEIGISIEILITKF